MTVQIRINTDPLRRVLVHIQCVAANLSDNFAGWEGKIDEVAVYDRALEPAEVARHYRAAGLR